VPRGAAPRLEEAEPLMTFPPSPRVVYGKNPLEEVICQLQFPTILKIRTDLPTEFQERIRDRYPIYQSEQPQVPKEIAEMIAHLPGAIPTGTHRFSTAEGSKSIILSPEFVTFSDKKYERWETFSEEVERARRGIEEIYSPSFYTRIGLRYRD